jgi:hypothetical protein
MGRKILWWIIALCAILGITALARPNWLGETGQILGFLAVPVGGMLLTAAFLYRPKTPFDPVVPDLLDEKFGPYFDQDGFSFVPSLATSQNESSSLACFRIAYQNRWSGDCVAKVMCWPVDGWSKTGQHEVPPVTPTIECAGGEAAVLDIPYPIGRRFRGMEMLFDIVCSTEFPAGKGVQLSASSGMSVGKICDAELRDMAVTGALLLTGHVGFRQTTPANLRVILPTEVAEQIPPDLQPTVTILYTHTPATEHAHDHTNH